MKRAFSVVVALILLAPVLALLALLKTVMWLAADRAWSNWLVDTAERIEAWGRR